MSSKPQEIEVEETNVEETKLKEVADKIRVILETENYALQPFISYSPYGIQPSVRLIKISEDNANETGNNEEAGASSEEVRASEPQ